MDSFSPNPKGGAGFAFGLIAQASPVAAGALTIAGSVPMFSSSYQSAKELVQQKPSLSEVGTSFRQLGNSWNAMSEDAQTTLLGNAAGLAATDAAAFLGARMGYKASGTLTEDTSKIPGDIQKTLDRIQSGESYPHRNDGSIFRNDKQPLPSKADGYYRQYVHPTEGVSGPGLQRVITGQGGERYYTPDHYETFIRIKK